MLSLAKQAIQDKEVAWSLKNMSPPMPCPPKAMLPHTAGCQVVIKLGAWGGAWGLNPLLTLLPWNLVWAPFQSEIFALALPKSPNGRCRAPWKVLRLSKSCLNEQRLVFIEARVLLFSLAVLGGKALLPACMYAYLHKYMCLSSMCHISNLGTLQEFELFTTMLMSTAMFLVVLVSAWCN